MKKRWFVFIFVLVVFLLPFSASSSVEDILAEAADRGFLCEATDQLTLRVLKYTGQENKLVIPDKINILYVTEIGESAFAETTLSSIQFPMNLRFIGERAFQDCTELQQAIGITVDLSDYAFSGCPSLQTLIFGNKIQRIGNYAFKDCISLQSIEIPESVLFIGEGAFAGCTSLQAVYLPNPEVVIGSGAFPATTVVTGPGGPIQITQQDTVSRDAQLIGSWIYDPAMQDADTDYMEETGLFAEIVAIGEKVRLDLYETGEANLQVLMEDASWASDFTWSTEPGVLHLDDNRITYKLDGNTLSLQAHSAWFRFRKLTETGMASEEKTIEETKNSISEWVSQDLTITIPQSEEEKLEAVQTLININESLRNAVEDSGIEDVFSDAAMTVVELQLQIDSRVLLYARQPEGIFYMTRTGLVCLYSAMPRDPETTGTMTPEEAVKLFSDGKEIPGDTVIPDMPVMTNNTVRLFVLDDTDITMVRIYNVAGHLLDSFANRIEGNFIYQLGTEYKNVLDYGHADCGFFELAAHGTLLFDKIYMEANNITDSYHRISDYIVNSSGLMDLFPNADFLEKYKEQFRNYVNEGIMFTSGLTDHVLKSIEETGTIILYDAEEKITRLAVSGEKLQSYWDRTAFDNTIIFLDICYAADDSEFIQWFLDHGAAAVFCEHGNKWSITEQMKTLSFLTNGLADGMAITEAIHMLREDPEVRSNVIATFNADAYNADLKKREWKYKENLLNAGYTKEQFTQDLIDQEHLEEMNRTWHGSDSSADNMGIFRQYPFPNQHIIYGEGILHGKVFRTLRDQAPVTDGEVTLYRWINHHFVKYERTKLINGTYSIAGVPYGLYAVKAEAEDIKSWTPLCFMQEEKEFDLVLMNADIQSIVILDDCYQGGSDSVLRIYAIDSQNHLILDEQANPAFFTESTHLEWASIVQAMEESEDPSLRIWKLDGATLFSEFASINDPSPYLPEPDDIIRYTVWQLGSDGKFHPVKQARTGGSSGMIDFYENGELTASYPYSEGNLDLLQEAFSAENVIFGNWEIIDRTYYSNEVPITHYAQVSFPDEANTLLLFNSRSLNNYRRLLYSSKQEILNRWYHPEDVRTEPIQTQTLEPDSTPVPNSIDIYTSELRSKLPEFSMLTTDGSFRNEPILDQTTEPIDIYISDLEAQLPGLSLIATDRNVRTDGIWSETYQAPGGCTVQVTVEAASGRITEILMDDSCEFEWYVWHDPYNPMVFRFSPKMQALVDSTASSSAVALCQETRDALFDTDFALRGSFTTDDEFRRILEYSEGLGEVQVTVYKMLNFVSNEYVESWLKLSFLP